MVEHGSEPKVMTYLDLFEAGIEIEDCDSEEREFGEYLIAERAITRAELNQALRTQDDHPGVRLAEIIAWLGYLPYPEVDRFLTCWRANATATDA